MMMFLRGILRSLYRSSLSWTLLGLVSCATGLPLYGGTFVVDRFDDANGSCDPGDCSLREALLAAEGIPEQHTVILPAGRHTLSIPPVAPGDLSRGDLEIILFDVEIIAPDGAVIDAQGIDRVFRFWRSSISRLVNLTITGGSALIGGGILVESSDLELENVWIVDNQADRGAGLEVLLGTVTLDHVTISGNQARGAGGGIWLLGIGQTVPETIGRLEIRNSTISGNHADQVGGAIFIGGAGQLVLQYSTIAENTNRPGDETISSILAADVAYTLVEGGCRAGTDAKCIYLTSWADKLDVADLGLEPLAVNGGVTPTHALLPASPAIDVVPLAAACPSADQRGAARPQDGDGDREARCDAGSFELIRAPSSVEIPTLGETARLALMLLLACAGVVALRR